MKVTIISLTNQHCRENGNVLVQAYSGDLHADGRIEQVIKDLGLDDSDEVKTAVVELDCVELFKHLGQDGFYDCDSFKGGE
jgi:hypothetical protein